MAKPTSLPTQALDHAADHAQTVLEGLPPVTPPAAPTLPEHTLPTTSVAIPDQALPLPEAAHVPEWLIG